MIVVLWVVGVIVGLITFAFYRLSTNRARYFQERNLKYTGALLGLRNLFGLFFRRSDIYALSKQMYEKFPNET